MNTLLAIENAGTGDGSSGLPIQQQERCIQTAIGCVPFENTTLIATTAVNIGIGIGGGVALVIIVIASYQIMTSQGDPRRLQAAKELLAAAIGGILLIVFAGFTLRLIGVDILGLF